MNESHIRSAQPPHRLLPLKKNWNHFCLDCHSVCDNVYRSLTMFSALAAVCTVDCAIEIVLITLHYITLLPGGPKKSAHDCVLETRHKEIFFFKRVTYLHIFFCLLTLTHTPNCAPHWVCVLFYWCIRTQLMILGISLLGDPGILSVLVCLASVCIIVRILRQCSIVVRFYP